MPRLSAAATQSSGRGELATSAASLPRKLVGAETIMYARRPSAWRGLTNIEAAILDVLRRSGRTSELAPRKTVDRVIDALSERGTLGRLLRIAAEEPPRVRAMLGAFAEHVGRPARSTTELRASLNPASRFEFGPFTSLPNARQWQAKERG